MRTPVLFLHRRHVALTPRHHPRPPPPNSNSRRSCFWHDVCLSNNTPNSALSCRTRLAAELVVDRHERVVRWERARRALAVHEQRARPAVDVVLLDLARGHGRETTGRARDGRRRRRRRRCARARGDVYGAARGAMRRGARAGAGRSAARAARRAYKEGKRDRERDRETERERQRDREREKSSL